MRGNLEARGSLTSVGEVQGGQVTLCDATAKLLIYEIGYALEETLAGVVGEALWPECVFSTLR